MPRKRISIKQFENGLWVAGSRDTGPDGAMRRNRGIHPIRTGVLRPRLGSSLLFSRPANSLFRFAESRFQASNGVLYKDNTELRIVGPNRLAFLRMPPTAGKPDYLFIADASATGLIKVDTDGVITDWGIIPPTHDFVATAQVVQSRTVDLFDATTGWSISSGSIATEATIKQEGANSLKATVAPSETVFLTKSVTVDLSGYASGTVSADQDFIAFWVRIDDPINLRLLEVQFSLGNTSFATDTYTRSLEVNSLDASSQEALGLSDVSGVSDNQETVTDGTFASSPLEQVQVLEAIADTSLPNTQNTWIRLRIPKSTFKRDGGAAVGWANVQAIRFTITTQARGGVNIYFDDLQVEGGTGTQGTYKYKVTFRNTTTGTRSNPNTNAVTVTSVRRQAIVLSGLPISPDPQVDQREIWRTVGNGTRFFRIGSVDNNSATTFTDNVADFAGLDTRPDTLLMESTELPVDNILPEGFSDTWGPYQARAWWCRSGIPGQGGQVFYSPVGRAEAVEGFIIVTNDDDPTQKGLFWNGQNWVFTESRLFRIDGSGPYIAREVFGVPGTAAPHTVVGTPFGIVYQAIDGVRIFNGVAATLVSPNSILPLFRGEDAENLTAFAGVVATYGRDEYFISDGAQTLAVNLTDGRWRDVGLGCAALYTEPDTGAVLAGVGNTVLAFDIPTVLTDGGIAIPFEAEPISLLSGVEPMTVEKVYVDILTNNQEVDATVLIDDTELDFGPMVSGTRQVFGYDINETGRVVGVRFNANLIAPIGIYGVYLEVYLPEVT